jgi:hypothetical protein
MRGVVCLSGGSGTVMIPDDVYTVEVEFGMLDAAKTFHQEKPTKTLDILANFHRD